MTQKLIQLQETIREVCPELGELTFGCEIHRKGVDMREMFAGSFADEYSITRIGAGGAFLPITIPKPPESQEFEIIGHPIQLQHILWAMPERSFNMAHINHGVLLFEYYSNEEDSFVFVGFHLGEDLSAPENAPFVEWAHSIICKG